MKIISEHKLAELIKAKWKLSLLEEAITYKKNKDIEYLNILVEKHPLTIDNFNIIKRYVEIFEYPSNILRST